MTAFLLIPRMIVAAFAVDVGAWYAHASQLQRASDAAALAAVVHLPDEDVAWNAALNVASANGIADATPGNRDDFLTGPDPQMRMTVGADNTIKIDLRENSEAYFGKVIVNSVNLTRGSTAQYVLPVPMGSYTNVLGLGNETYGGTPGSGTAIQMMSYCVPSDFGDQRAAHYLFGCPTDTSPGSLTLDENHTSFSYTDASNRFSALPISDGSSFGHDVALDRNGYWFVVDIPQAYLGSVTVRGYDLPFCKGNKVDGSGNLVFPGDFSAGSNSSEWTLWRHHQARLQFEWRDGSATPFGGPTAAVPMGTYDPGPSEFPESWPSAPNGFAAGIPANVQCNTWQDMFTIPSGRQGRHFIRAYVDETWMGGHSHAGNFFALAADMSTASGTTCDSRTSAQPCVGMYALDALPLRALTGTSAAEFPLAQVGSVHSGKTLEVRLMDPGENMKYVQILDPDGTPMDFKYRTADGGIPLRDHDTTYDGGTMSCDPCLDVSVQVAAGLYAGYGSPVWKYDGRIVILEVPLTVSNWGDEWFEIRYQPGTSVLDNTTWQVKVIGDPVRLTE